MPGNVPLSDLDGSLADAAVRMGLHLSDEVRARLLGYLQLLQRWNGTYNLTAVRDPGQMFTHHLLDCLAVVPSLVRRLPDRPARVLDVGSGGGLPGAVLAIVRPELAVTCVDTVGKKAAFIRQAAAELGVMNLGAVHGRVESLETTADVVVSRAFASLADFCRLTEGCVAEGGVWMAMKGRTPNDEIAALPAQIDVFHVEQLQVPGLNAERCLVWMRPRRAA